GRLSELSATTALRSLRFPRKSAGTRAPETDVLAYSLPSLTRPFDSQTNTGGGANRAYVGASVCLAFNGEAT
ncbi:hypothetical protein J6590_105558, partial [Homalodisca vitripennis]